MKSNKSQVSNNQDQIPPGFKQTDIGLIPEDWNLIPLDNEGYFKTINGLWKGKKPPFKKVTVIRNTNFTESGLIDYSDVAVLDVEEKQYSSRKLFPGDIIIERSGGGPTQPVGRVVFFDRTTGEYSFSNFTSCLRTLNQNEFLLKYVFYSLLNFYLSGKTDSLQARTTGIRNLDFTSYKEKAGIPKLSLPEQKKIAYVLSKIQQAIETQEQIIKTTQELKKALMQKLFTEGLNGEPQKQTEIGPIPESWEVVPFSSIAEFKNGINFSKEQKGDKGILTIDVLNMYGRSYFVEFDNLYRVNKKIDESYLLKEDDLLFVRSSLKLEGVGWSSLFKGNTEPTTYCGFIIRARISDLTINKKYLTYFFRTNFARSKLISKSAKLGITNINQGNLGNVLVPIPNQKEQDEIVSVLLNLDSKLEFLTRNKEVQQELFKNMLNQLMTGQIRVKDIEFKLEENINTPTCLPQASSSG